MCYNTNNILVIGIMVNIGVKYYEIFNNQLLHQSTSLINI